MRDARGDLETLFARALLGSVLRMVFVADMERSVGCFINVLRDKAQQSKNCLAQLNAMIVEMEAVDDSDEVYDSLKCLREDMLPENDKLMGLNQFVADAEEDIEHEEVNIQMLKLSGNLNRNGWGIFCFGGYEIRDYCKEAREAKIVLRGIANRRALFIEELDSLGVRHVPAKFAEFLKEIQTKDMETLANLQILVREIELNASHGSYGCAVSAIGYLLTEQAESTYLKDKMKFWFTRARTKDQAFAVLMRDICLELKIKMHKTQRLITALEALGEVGDVVTSLNHMREIVGRESAKLAVLEQLSASTDVAMRLKGHGIKGVVFDRSLSFVGWFAGLVS
ncbi:hypothetical protein Tco_0709189 [Tanacetum coccineum]